MFPVTSLSHHHLTSIIGLLLFIYLPWQENRGEVTQSHQSLLAGSGVWSMEQAVGAEDHSLADDERRWLIPQWLKGELQYMCVKIDQSFVSYYRSNRAYVYDNNSLQCTPSEMPAFRVFSSCCDEQHLHLLSSVGFISSTWMFLCKMSCYLSKSEHVMCNRLNGLRGSKCCCGAALFGVRLYLCRP